MRRALVTVASEFLVLVEKLPEHAENTPYARDVLSAENWNRDRVEDLVAFGVETEHDHDAVEAGAALRWLGHWVHYAQRHGPDYAFTDFPVDDWNAKLKSARQALRRLIHLFTINGRRFAVVDHNPGHSQIKSAYVREFLNVMVELELLDEE